MEIGWINGSDIVHIDNNEDDVSIELKTWNVDWSIIGKNNNDYSIQTITGSKNFAISLLVKDYGLTKEQAIKILEAN